MQFAHNSTPANPIVRPDRGQLAQSLATKQIRDADRCTAVELGDLIQLTSIRCLFRRVHWTAFFFQQPDLRVYSQISITDEDFSEKLTK